MDKMDKKVIARFEQYPDHIRDRMIQFRDLIIDVAASNAAIGELEETTKWGEPAYLTSQTGSGTTVRIDWKAKRPADVAMFVSCQTTLLDQYRGLFPELDFDGNRAVWFPADESLPEGPVRACIDLALRYHINKKK